MAAAATNNSLHIHWHYQQSYHTLHHQHACISLSYHGTNDTLSESGVSYPSISAYLYLSNATPKSSLPSRHRAYLWILGSYRGPSSFTRAASPFHGFLNRHYHHHHLYIGLRCCTFIPYFLRCTTWHRFSLPLVPNGFLPSL